MWISNLLANQRVMKYNAGDVIIREAFSDGRVYMLLTGHASVVHHDGRQKAHLAQMEAGRSSARCPSSWARASATPRSWR